MGSSASKNEETNEIKAVQEMDEEELSSKDKLFKKAIVEIYEELKKVKDQKKDKFIYTVPKVDLCNWSLFWLNNIIKIILSNLYWVHIVLMFFGFYMLWFTCPCYYSTTFTSYMLFLMLVNTVFIFLIVFTRSL